MRRYKDALKGISDFCIKGITEQGGWGAEFGYYNETNPLNTAEVLCGLLLSKRFLFDGFITNTYDETIDKAINYILKTQLPSGGWATGSAYIKKDSNAIGNIVSTSWSVWALSEYILLKDYNFSEGTPLMTAINNSIMYLNSSKKTTYWSYCPKLDNPLIMPSSYSYLALGSIFKNSKITSLLEEKYLLILKNLIMETIDSVINNFKKNKENCSVNILTMASCIYHIAFQFLEDNDFLKPIIEKILEAQDFFYQYITEQDDAILTNTFTETQAVIENDNKVRDFIHYLPLWVLIVYSYNFKQGVPKLYHIIRDLVFANIHENYLGASYDGHSKRFAWTSGLTLIAISMLKNNTEVICTEFNHLNNLKIVKADPKKVFVAFGRNKKIQRSFFSFLRACGLSPIEWESAVRESSKGSPHITEILDAAFKQAQAIIILLTGDEQVELIEKLKDANENCEQPCFQSRPNVLFEAGLAYGQNPERTIFVQVGEHRTFSDIEGIHIIRFKGASNERLAIRKRLQTAGCAITDEQDWLNEGDFTE